MPCSPTHPNLPHTTHPRNALRAQCFPRGAAYVPTRGRNILVTARFVLQESVEGLSVVAITYYTAGVLGYAAKGAHSLGYLPIAPEVRLRRE